MDKKYPKFSFMGIVSIISIIIMLLFLCYKTLMFENRLVYLENALNAKIDEVIVLNNALLNMENQRLENAENQESSVFPAETAERTVLQVYITGEVNNPGIYDMAEGSRLNDVIEAAGGLTEEAAVSAINLAEYIFDTAHIIIAKIGEDPPQTIDVFANKNEAAIQTSDFSAYEKPAYTGIVNINTAGINELMSLPGIGQVAAQNIIDYRNKNGSFKSIEEIKNVSRIGDGTFNNIEDKIKVD